jgi:predicted helicase
VQKKIDWQEYIKPYSYRPFDTRYICYLSDLIERGCDRYDLMKNFFQENVGLVTTRILSSMDFKHVFISEMIGDMCFISNRGKEANYFFPLYIYLEEKPKKKEKLNPTAMMLFEEKEKYQVKMPNINPEIFKKLEDTYKTKILPEDIFYYIYGVLYSNTYRKKYAEFLKIDFPRIPFTDKYKLFKTVGKYGKELADLHLLKSISNSSAKFQGKGDDRVKKVVYDGKKQLVYINNEQYFEGIAENVWNYQIGGYQVLEKWLKDRKERKRRKDRKERKGRVLSLDDIKHYCQITTTLRQTIEIQKDIDKLYPEVEKETIEIQNRR